MPPSAGKRNIKRPLATSCNHISMDKPPNRVKINNDLWFNVQPDKLIFGGTFLPKGYHLTFPFGIKSGQFDLHLTKENVQFPIIIISHADFFLAYDHFQQNLISSVLKNLRPVDKEIVNNDIIVYAISGFNKTIDNEFDRAVSDGIVGLKSNPASKRLKINQNSEKFNDFVENLMTNHQMKEMSFKEFSNLPSSSGFVETNGELFFLVKSQLTNNELRIFDFLNLDMKGVIKGTLGEKLAQAIFDEINQGKVVLEMENAEEEISKIGSLVLKIKTSS